MRTCQYRLDSALTRAFSTLCTTDVPEMIRALHAAIVFDCPGAFAADPFGHEARTWVSPLGENGVAILRIEGAHSTGEPSLSVEVQSRYRDEAETLFNRIVNRASSIARIEVSDMAVQTAPGGHSDDLPF